MRFRYAVGGRVKQNTTLNDEIKAKTEIIKILQEKEDIQVEKRQSDTETGIQKCKECNYKTHDSSHRSVPMSERV